MDTSAVIGNDGVAPPGKADIARPVAMTHTNHPAKPAANQPSGGTVAANRARSVNAARSSSRRRSAKSARAQHSPAARTASETGVTSGAGSPGGGVIPSAYP